MNVVRCRHCRRRLKDPDSRRRGVGRDCATKHGEWVSRPRIRRPDAVQDEALFDLDEAMNDRCGDPPFGPQPRPDPAR